MTEPNISIVTAFYDIGRGSWEGWVNGNPLPTYLKRTNEEYFSRFERLLKLENDITVFTEAKFYSTFKDLSKKHNKTIGIIDFPDWKDVYADVAFYQRIEKIQQEKEFANMIKQPWNPEYWSPEYVMINALKSFFVNSIINNGLTKEKLVAWIDFGYAREDADVPTNVWNYDFDPQKIHLFTQKQEIPSIDHLYNIVYNNVIFQGCHIVADATGWLDLETMMHENYMQLFFENMMDDDQGVLAMCYRDKKQAFEVHHNPGPNWFTAFRNFNNGI